MRGAPRVHAPGGRWRRAQRAACPSGSAAMEFLVEVKDSWALQAPFDLGEGGRIGCVVVETPLPDTRRTSSSVAI